jgi:hypothetical protein
MPPSVVCMKLPYFQHSAAAFLHRCTGSFLISCIILFYVCMTNFWNTKTIASNWSRKICDPQIGKDAEGSVLSRSFRGGSKEELRNVEIWIARLWTSIQNRYFPITKHRRPRGSYCRQIHCENLSTDDAGGWFCFVRWHKHGTRRK